MTNTIDLTRLTGGKMTGEITVIANGWETRHSWGHRAEILDGCRVVARANIRYYNRTWESYRFQSVIHIALMGYVHGQTGFNPIKPICKRDATPMKSAAAEARRLERVAAHDFAAMLYKRLTGVVDGTYTYAMADRDNGRKVA